VTVEVAHAMSGFACAEFATVEQAAFVNAIEASTASVSDGQVTYTGCADTDRRRSRRLQASADTTEISTDIKVAEHSDGTAGSTLISEVETAASDGSFATALVAASSTSSVLATAIVSSVSAEDTSVGEPSDAGEDEEPMFSGDRGRPAAARCILN
jgi:hypothetical protein